FTLALTYALPSIKTKWQLTEGWQLNSLVTSSGGTPWTVLDGVLNGTDISATGEFADRWDFFGNPKDFKAGPAAIPCLVSEGFRHAPRSFPPPALPLPRLWMPAIRRSPH